VHEEVWLQEYQEGAQKVLLPQENEPQRLNKYLLPVNYKKNF
jgi:hypothetical protein